jgi:hypothetical protein
MAAKGRFPAKAKPVPTISTILPALAERGIDVSVALVGQIKQRMKKSGESGSGKSMAKKKAVKKKLTSRKAMTKKTTAATSRAAKALTADDLVEAKKLVDDLGGIDQTREALKYLEELG